MNSRINDQNNSERRQQIALCASTFYKMNGRQPNASELCGWLDRSYFGEIVKYLNKDSFPRTVCA